MTYKTELSELPGCDVVVAGGGMAGVMAALASAQAGAVTVLVEQHAFVGGQGTAGGVHTFCGETRLVNDLWRDMLQGLRRLSGLADYRPNADGRAFEAEALKFVFQEMLAEADVRLLLHTRLVDVERDGQTARALILHNKSGLQRLACSQVIDATGDADVIALGGWAYLKGGPAFKPGEELSLDTDSPPRQLPMSLYFTMVDTGHEVTPYLPAGCPSYQKDTDLPMTTVIAHDNRVTVKMKVIGFDATNGEELSQSEQEGRRQMMSVVHYLQTIGYGGKQYPRHALAWVFPHIGIREGRRVMGQYVMTADDVLSGRHFDDAVAVGSYHTDYHWPNVVQRAGTGITSQCPPYQIPLRAMRPVDAANILVPGRCLSGEQMAMSSFRVMGICAQTGYAAGTAAAMAVSKEAALDQLDIAALQAALRKGGVRLDLAPYYNYLRRRRSVVEVVATPGTTASAMAATLLPDGDAIVAWTQSQGSGWNALVAVRHEERWSEAMSVATDLPGPSLELETQDTGRLSAEGVEEGQVSVQETDGPPELILRLADRTLRALGGGRDWAPDKVTQTQAPTEECRTLELVSSPGDENLLVRMEGVALLGSENDGLTWPHRLDLADGLAPGPTPALMASSDGLVLVYVDSAGRIRFRRLSPDILVGGEGFPSNWHHDESTWVDLLKGHGLQPQRDGVDG